MCIEPNKKRGGLKYDNTICYCDCHSNKNVHHMMACCFPDPNYKTPFELMMEKYEEEYQKSIKEEKE